MPPHFDLVCLSHLRWDWVFQRPQHLLSRAARERRVFFVEEPREGDSPHLSLSHPRPSLTVATPHLPAGLSHDEAERAQQQLLTELLGEQGIDDYILWYYTPMALGFTTHLRP